MNISDENADRPKGPVHAGLAMVGAARIELATSAVVNTGALPLSYAPRYMRASPPYKGPGEPLSTKAP